MTHSRSSVDDYSPDEPASFSLQQLRRYANVIVFSTVAAAVAYTIIALLVYLLAPSQRLTTQTFRLDFAGAAVGKYPNGSKFNPAEIVAVPTLSRIYAANQLSRYVSFDDFSRSVFVLEANPEYEKLVEDYRSRLSDPRLPPVDRDRLQREFDLRRESIAKNTYSLSYAQNAGLKTLPDALVRKSFLDILGTWAAHAVNDEHVLDYRLSVLTPRIFDTDGVGDGDPIMAIQVLRSKINRVLDNIRNLGKVPAADLVLSHDGMSLQEIQLRIEELKRFRLEPLVPLVYSGGLVKDRQAAISFLESQLAYDQRQLHSQEMEAEHVRQAFAIYVLDGRGAATASSPSSTPTPPQSKKDEPATDQRGTDAVTPQLSDSFLDRLMAITNRSADVAYRQSVADDFRTASAGVIPAQQAVDYDLQILQQIRTGAPSGVHPDAAAIKAEMDAVRREAQNLVGKVNEIYKLMNRNLNPSTELYTPTAPPVTRTERSVSLTRLAVYGVVTILFAIVVTCILCFVHQQMHAEDGEPLENVPAL